MKTLAIMLPTIFFYAPKRSDQSTLSHDTARHRRALLPTRYLVLVRSVWDGRAPMGEMRALSIMLPTLPV